MNKLLTLLALANLALWNSTAIAEGDYDAGARKSIYCAYCHGYDGNPVDASVPRLAGQKVEYIIARIKDLEASQTMHQQMRQAVLTGDLENADIADLATFYARQPIRKR